MKKLLLMLLVLSPLTLTAAPQNLVYTWVQYPDASAVINSECKLSTEPDTAYVTVFSNISAALVTGDLTVDATEGQTIICRLWASNASTTSPRSEVATYRVPFLVLPAPQNLSLGAR